MQPLNPARPDELSSLMMENELLRFEVAHLRSRLAVATTRPTKGGTKGAAKTPATTTATTPVTGTARATIDAARRQTAYDDLVWLLRRLDGSPAGFLLRRVEGFRTLRGRYLAEPPA